MGTSNQHLEITGGNDSAISALTEVQAAIDALHGRSVSVDVNVNGVGAAVGGLAATGAASDAAAAAAGRHASAADRASSSMRDHAAESKRAAESLHGLGGDSDRVERSLGDLGSGADRAGQSFSELSGAASEAQKSVGGIGASGAEGAKTFEDMWQAMGHGADGAVRASSSFAALDSSFRAVDEGSAGSARALGDVGGAGVSAARGFEGVGRSAESGTQFMAGASGAAQSVSRSLAPLASSASHAGSAMGAAAVSASSLGNGANAAASGMKVASQNASGAYQIFNITGTAMNNAASGGSAFSSRLNNMTPPINFLSNSLGGLGPTLSSVGDAFGHIGSAGMIAGVGMGVGAIGMGVLAAATAAVGIGGFALDVMKSTGAMNDLRDVTRAATSGFSAMKNETAAAAAPAMPGLVASVKGVSRELASLGVQSEPAILQGLTTLGTDATGTMQKLAPAITPAINALTALGGAALGAFGDSAGPIADFSNSVTAAAPGMQKTLDAMVGGLAKLGETGATVLGSSALKNMFQATGNVIGAGDDLFMGLGGYPSNQIGQKNAQGQPTQMSALDRAGLALKGTAQIGLSALDPLTAMGGGSLAQSGQYNLREARSGQTPQPPPGTDSYHSQGSMGDMFGKETYDPAQFKPGTEPKAAMGDIAHGGLPGFTGPVASATATTPMPSERAGAARGPDTTQPGWNWGAMTPGMGKPGTPPPAQVEAGRSVGSSVGLPSPAAMGELNAALRATPAAAAAAGQSLQQVGPQANQSMQQAGQSAQHVPQALQTAMAQAAPAVAAAMAPVAPAIQAAIPPQALAQPMAHTVAQAQDQTAPAASDAGSNIGASMTSGASAGVTKTETETLTVVRKWIEKVIDEGASALDARSPAGKFIPLGESIPQGVTVGINNDAGTSVQAVRSLMGDVVSSAQSTLGAGGATAALGTQAGSQLGQQFGQGYTSQVGSHLDGLNGPLGAHRDAVDKALGQAGHKDLVPPHAADQTKRDQEHKQALDEQAKAHSDAAGAAGDHTKSMAELNREQGTGVTLGDRQNQHSERAQALAQQRAERHDAAQYRALHGMGDNPADPNSLARDANAWRNPAKDAAGNIVEGSLDQRNAVTKQQNLVNAQNTQPQAQSDQVAAAQAQTNKSLGTTGQLFQQQGNANGAAYGQGTAQGITNASGQVADAANKNADAVTAATKKKLGISSPSQVAADIYSEFGAGAAVGINDSTAGLSSIASNAGLPVGYVYGQSMVTGVTSIIKSADFQTAAVSGIGSQLAETALGALGMLGPAGSGAEIYKTPAVTLDNGTSNTPPQPIVIYNYTTLDGQVIDRKITNAQVDLVNGLTSVLATQAS